MGEAMHFSIKWGAWAVSERMRKLYTSPHNALIAQRESSALTKRRSMVRIHLSVLDSPGIRIDKLGTNRSPVLAGKRLIA